MDVSRRRLVGLLPAALATLPLAALAAPMAGEKRVALVIGNSAYRSEPLKNPANDAIAVGEALTALGYEVTLRQNTTLAGLIESLRDFSVRSAAADVRFFFYAGHGIQSRGRNYLLPVDTQPRGDDEVSAKCADIGEFVDRLGANKRGLNIVVLDACRVNPFIAGVVNGPDGRALRFRGPTPTGLARMEAPIGTLLAFSTSPGGVAADSPKGPHSIYAKHLLANIQTPGLQIEQFFKRVRIGVAEETQRNQVPWEQSSLTGEFCFKSDAKGQCGA